MAVDMGTGSLQKRGQLGTVGLARGSRLGWRLRATSPSCRELSSPVSLLRRGLRAWFTAPNLLPRCHFGRGSATPGTGPPKSARPSRGRSGLPGLAHGSCRFLWWCGLPLPVPFPVQTQTRPSPRLPPRPLSRTALLSRPDAGTREWSVGLFLASWTFERKDLGVYAHVPLVFSS